MKFTILSFALLANITFALTGLTVGSDVPNITLKNTAGRDFNFAKQSKKTTIAVFYRGSW